MAKMEKIGSLWEKLSKKGDTFMSGMIGGKKVIVFKNTYKKGNQPDWNVFPEQSRDELPERQPGDEETPF